MKPFNFNNKSINNSSSSTNSYFTNLRFQLKKKLKQELFVVGKLNEKLYFPFTSFYLQHPLKITQITYLEVGNLIFIVDEKKDLYYCEKYNFIKCDISNVKLITSSSNYLMIVTFDNEIYETSKDLVFTKSYEDFTKEIVMNSENIIKICGGWGFTIILTNKNNIYVKGFNIFGQLGTGDYENVLNFTKINNVPKDIIDIGCSDTCILILTKFGDLYLSGLSCGEQYYLNFTKIDISNNQEYYTNGKLYLYYKYLNLNLPKIKKISNTNKLHILILTLCNELYVTGSNNFGELGIQKSEQDSSTNKYNIEKVTGFKLPYSNNYLIAGQTNSIILSSEYLVNEDFIEFIEMKEKRTWEIGKKCLKCVEHCKFIDIIVVIATNLLDE
ncbi:hypothetical protein ABK040_000709 [Willaertia magna]